MSTTTWFEPARSTSRIARRSAPSSALKRALDDERLAEDARRLGERHRQEPLEVGAFGQRRVVVGVAELVRQRLRRVGAARPVHQHQRAVADERHAERAADLAVARSGVDPPLVDGAGDQPAELGAVVGEGVVHGRHAFVPAQGRRGNRARGDEIPPRQTRLRIAAVERVLGPHPPPEVGQRVAYRRLHRVERRPADGVGEQRGVERVVPVAPAVDDRRLALDRVDRCGTWHGDLGPGGQLGGVGGAPDRRIAVVGEPAHSRHRQPLSSAGEVYLGGELRRDVAVEVLPRRRADGGELGVEVFLGLAHLVRGAGGEAEQRAGMLGGDAAVGGERRRTVATSVQRVDPVGEASEQRLEARLGTVQLAEQRLRRLVAAVSADGGVDVAAELGEQHTEVVDRADRLVGGPAVWLGRLARLDGADAVAIERRGRSRRVGMGLFERGPELARVERRVQIGHAPARQLVCEGDAWSAHRPHASDRRSAPRPRRRGRCGAR